MTGLSAPGRQPLGVKTFRYRQSSDVLAWPNGPASCGQCGANAVAARTPDQLAAGCGGCHRSGPTGGAAYGMPRNSSTAPSARPRTAPLAVTVTGPPAAWFGRLPADRARPHRGRGRDQGTQGDSATASRASARRPVHVTDIQVSLHG